MKFTKATIKQQIKKHLIVRFQIKIAKGSCKSESQVELHLVIVMVVIL